MTVRSDMARASRWDWGASRTTGPTFGEPGAQNTPGRRLGFMGTRPSSSCLSGLLLLLSKIDVSNHQKREVTRVVDGAVVRAASVPTHACTKWFDPGNCEPPGGRPVATPPSRPFSLIEDADLPALSLRK